MDSYMLDRLNVMDKRMDEIDEQLATITDFSLAKKLNQERSLLQEGVELFREYKKSEQDLLDAKIMVDDVDKEIAELGKMEVERLSSLLQDLEKKIEISLLPKDANDDKNVIMEIRGAVGGDEGNIFAGDLYRMYLKYADRKGWSVKLLDEAPTPLGGFSIVSIMIKGKGV